MKVQTVPIDSIHADPANVRRHGERNLATIKASLARFGQQTPIVVDGNNICRKGNGTLAAALELGWSEIQVVRTPLAGSEATAYSIADNRTGELAEWDETGLAEQLRSLQSEDFDLAAVGYDAGEVDRLVEDLSKDIAGPLGSGPSGADPGGDDQGEDGFEVQKSQVRMVQLFLTVGTFPEFQRMTDELADTYGTANATDTVMECLRRATGSEDAAE